MLGIPVDPVDLFNILDLHAVLRRSGGPRRSSGLRVADPDTLVGVDGESGHGTHGQYECAAGDHREGGAASSRGAGA